MATDEELKQALKAFKKRLKFARLDDESGLSRGGGKKSGIVGLSPPSRFPSWIYQSGVRGLLPATLRPGTGLRYSRWWMARLYLCSGLSKLDRSFIDELGTVFLATLLRRLRFEPSTGPERWRSVLILAM